MANFWEKTFIEPVRNILRLDRKENNIPLDDTWKQINEMHEQENTNDLISRRREISESNMRDYYTGDLMGMSVFEGEVGITDERKPGGVSPVRVRVVLSREFDLPDSINPQHSGTDPKRNNNLLATLYFQAQKYLLGEYRGVFTNNNQVIENDGVQMLAQMIDYYEKLNLETECPLTIVLAHGHVEKSGQHVISSGKTEVYPTNLLLDELSAKYPVANKTDGAKLPVMLSSCNEDNNQSSTISHPKIYLGYRQGLSGSIINMTGKTSIRNSLGF